MKKLSVILVLISIISVQIYAHCEVPCGIYGDQLRVKMIKEHISTIEKAMKQIEKLGSEENINYNQIVRWVTTKEKHAEDIQTIVSKYFLPQRIKPNTDHYEDKLKSLHSILLISMKCKQTTDVKNIAKIKKEVEDFSKLYFDHKH